MFEDRDFGRVLKGSECDLCQKIGKFEVKFRQIRPVQIFGQFWFDPTLFEILSLQTHKK